MSQTIKNENFMKKLIIYLICTIIMQPLVLFAKTEIQTFNSNNNKINDYVLSLLNKGSEIFNDNTIEKKDRIIKIAGLIDKYLDMRWMAKFTLGHYRTSLTEEQINQFTAIYSEYLTNAYTNLAKNYSKAVAKIKNIETLSPGQFKLYASVSLDTAESSVDTAYLLHYDKITGELKIFDVITENLSLINAQREDFDSILANHSFEEFIKIIKSKIQD